MIKIIHALLEDGYNDVSSSIFSELKDIISDDDIILEKPEDELELEEDQSGNFDSRILELSHIIRQEKQYTTRAAVVEVSSSLTARIKAGMSEKDICGSLLLDIAQRFQRGEYVGLISPGSAFNYLTLAVKALEYEMEQIRHYDTIVLEGNGVVGDTYRLRTISEGISDPRAMFAEHHGKKVVYLDAITNVGTPIFDPATREEEWVKVLEKLPDDGNTLLICRSQHFEPASKEKIELEEEGIVVKLRSYYGKLPTLAEQRGIQISVWGTIGTQFSPFDNDSVRYFARLPDLQCEDPL